MDRRSCQPLVGVFKPARGRTKVSLRHSPEVSADIPAQVYQQHVEKQGANRTVHIQNRFDGSDDGSRARDEEVQDGDLGWDQRSR